MILCHPPSGKVGAVKGFPNQVTELPKIADGIHALVSLVDQGKDAKNDGIFGEALVRKGVAGTGHAPKPIDQYLREQSLKPTSGQSHRTTARGLRELYRKLNFIDDSGDEVAVNSLGRRAATFSGQAMNAPQIMFWQRVVRNILHDGGGGNSHPYQVLLRLVARKPGISVAKCALALEARDDTPEELDRIVELAELSEGAIRRAIGSTESNWVNAKKVFPKFAEQLGDVIRRNNSFYIADSPGSREEVVVGGGRQPSRDGGIRAPRRARGVNSATIGQAGIAESNEEFELPLDLDPAAAAAAIRLRAERLRRHNLLVREFARLLEAAGAQLYEDPFDILALIEAHGILVEVKSLDGTPPDERARVSGAVAQLLYYEAFVTRPVAAQATIQKVACFESKVSDAHIDWLNGLGIGVVWKADGSFKSDSLARRYLGPHIDEFR